MRQVRVLTVNGEAREVLARPQATLLEALRDGLGLTGTKQGCDKGDCGACTVLVDGEPVLACCTLAADVEGKAVRTIEGLATPDGPSRLQRAFDVCGALQCGFCQPGMMMSAQALLDRDPKPGLEDIKQALSGNLCRCTGYTKIFEAVQLAADPSSGRWGGALSPQVPALLGPPSPGFQVLGAPGRKADSIRKATGEARFADDVQLPRMVFGRILRSPHAHARIRGIDASAALAMPGVLGVITGRDLPVAYGIIPWTPDEHALAVEKVRYVGDGVAAVAAVDEATADAALRRIVVDYEVLPAVFSPAEALQPGAPLVHDADWKGRPRQDNLCKEVELAFGDVDAAFASAAATVRGHWSYSGSTHAAIEPHCAVAQWSPDGQLTLWSATQVSHYLHRELSKVLGVPAAKIRVIQPAVGGGFGGKSEPFDLEFCAALLSKRTGRPVKILYTREEVFYAHRGRHPMEFDFAIAADADGTVTAVENDITIDGGAFHSFGLVTTYYAGQLLCGPIRFANYRYQSRRVYTNKPCCGPKRGHGSVQPRFPLETALDEIAEKLQIDPIEIRRRNAIRGGEYTVNGQLVGSSGILECLDAVERGSGWKDRYSRLPAGVGLGVATSMYISGTAYPIYPNEMPQSGVAIRADRSGKLTVTCGTNDIGQGCDGMLAYIVAEETGVPLDDIVVISGDTDLCPVDLGAYSSRITLMAGLAALEAGRSLRASLVAAVAAKWGLDGARIQVGTGELFDREDPAKRVAVIDALHWAESAAGTPIVAVGGYRTRKVGGDYRGGTIGASPAYSATAHVAEVSVDEDTGVVQVLRVWAAHDCGKAINPVMVEGQIEGSVYMGVSEALFEDMGYRTPANRDKAGERAMGLHVGPSLLDYRIMTSVDVPDIQAMIVESHDPVGPYGAKEAGEGPLHPAIPAVANAIWRATGARLREMPFTPERVRAAIRAARAAGIAAPTGSA